MTRTAAPLTKPQQHMLARLAHRGRVANYNLRSAHIAMLRRMEERGLVHSNRHGEWTMTNSGIAALARARDEEPTP